LIVAFTWLAAWKIVVERCASGSVETIDLPAASNRVVQWLASAFAAPEIGRVPFTVSEESVGSEDEQLVDVRNLIKSFPCSGGSCSIQLC
jgi:hypothetical protein